MTLRSTSSFTSQNPPHSFHIRALNSFASAVETATGADLVVDTTPLSAPDLVPLRPIAQALARTGILRRLWRTHPVPDEPPFLSWNASYDEEESAAGSSATSDASALASALAECLERHLWRSDTGHMRGIRYATEFEMRGVRHTPVNNFAGFSPKQREQKALALLPTSSFAWIRGRCLESGKDIFVPAQVTGAGQHMRGTPFKEQVIRPRITTGLATGPTRNFALLNGALEVIERDAFMITWLNQLSCPRVDLTSLAASDPELAALLALAARYRMRVHVVRLVTDAPTYVVCAVVEDDMEDGVPFVVGLGVGARLSSAAAHSVREALRIRKNIRVSWRHMFDAEKMLPRKVGHFERAVYWLAQRRYERLSFLTEGPLEKPNRAVWDTDTPDEHLERIIHWCTEKSYDCVSVAIGKTPNNPTPWHVEFVVIPELQPLHISERLQCVGGDRLTTVPKAQGYTPRTPLFSDEPHPFA